MVRHGESKSNREGIHHGQNAPLTDKGIREANIVAVRIGKIGVEAIISSSFPRAVETARPISKLLELPIKKSDLFVEVRRPSIVIGRSITDPEVLRVSDEVFEGYTADNHRHSDEENIIDLRTRTTAALELLQAHPKERLCVVTHGAFMRALLCAVLYGGQFSGYEYQRALNAIRTSNTGITYLTYGKGYGDKWGWSLVSWNDSAHLG